MEQCTNSKTVKSLGLIGVWIVIFATQFVLMVAPVAAEGECGTVKECAQEMVELANLLKDDNALLRKKIESLEAALVKQGIDNAAALQRRINTLKNGVDTNPYPMGNAKTNTCPAGTYMIGAVFQSDKGGAHGIVSSFQPVCRTMP